MTRTTPLRRTTLHFAQIFFTEARTFMISLRKTGKEPVFHRAATYTADGTE
jgi:hypothetical protein